jgi:ATP-dependent helicase/nuclease subunit A
MSTPSTPSAPLVDGEARRRIREDLDATLVVEAAAGTGKTSALIGRMLAVIVSGRARLAELVAVTFTEAAAGEMKLRLRQELEQARAAPNCTPLARSRLEQALGELEQAHLSTIHGFCGDLLRERPVEAGIDPAFEILDNEQSARLLDRCFERWLSTVIEEPPPGVRRALRRSGEGDSPYEQLRRAARELVEQRDFAAPWRREPLDRIARLDALVTELQRLIELGRHAASERDPLAREIEGLRAMLEPLLFEERTRGARDHDRLEFELRALVETLKWRNSGRGTWFGHELARADVIARRDAVQSQLQATLRDVEADLAACLREELRPVVAAYQQEKLRAGALDFLDLLIVTRDLLRAHPGVTEELRARFSQLFVDEFQDTDPLQSEILLMLAHGAAGLVPGKLFVVGDPKQSIYRFRRADVNLYERIKLELVEQGAQVLQLVVSFRSVPDLQSAINVGFAEHMRADALAGQVAYQPLAPYRPALADQPALIALPVPRPYSEYGRLANYAIDASYPDAVGAFVERLIAHSGYRVQERDGSLVPVAARHICLLFRRFKSYAGETTRAYVRALEARKIPHVLVGGRSFHAREEVLAMRTALTALEWPDDELLVFATLRGPLFSLGDSALLDYRMNIGKLAPLRPEPPAELTPDQAEVWGALQLLAELHRARNRRSIGETIAQLMDLTRTHAGIAIWPTGEQALANVLRIADQARRFEARGATSFRAFVERLQEQSEREEASDAPVLEEGTDGVRVMTVHGAKGLEFPVVILCDPTARRVGANPSRFQDRSTGLSAFRLLGCAPHELHDHAETLRLQDAAEEIRLAYVATTRARDLLVLPVVGDARRDGWTDLLHGAVYPAPAERRHSQPAPGLPEPGEDSVLFAPARTQRQPDDSVKPGLHAPEQGQHRVLWWDPAQLDLDRHALGGLRQQRLLVDEGAGPAARQNDAEHAAWQLRRGSALERGSAQKHGVRSVTALAQLEGEAAAVRVERSAAERAGRPAGKRFGSLVHLLLADSRFDAGAERLAALARLHARGLGASEAEQAAAVLAVQAALGHELLQRARAGTRHAFEAPICVRLDDGTLAEGIVDLCFREAGAPARWTVVDFKTDADPGAEPTYARQLALYARAIAEATGEPVEAVLLAV